jgi:hypothetical protein
VKGQKKSFALGVVGLCLFLDLNRWERSLVVQEGTVGKQTLVANFPTHFAFQRQPRNDPSPYLHVSFSRMRLAATLARLSALACCALLPQSMQRVSAANTTAAPLPAGAQSQRYARFGYGDS